MRVAAQRQHRRMLQQQQHIADALLVAQLHQLRLQPQALVVAHTPEIEVLNHGFIVTTGCFDRGDDQLWVRCWKMPAKAARSRTKTTNHKIVHKMPIGKALGAIKMSTRRMLKSTGPSSVRPRGT